MSGLGQTFCRIFSENVIGRFYSMQEVQAGYVKTSDFMNGLRAGVSIAIGYFPVAVTFGLLSKSSGLSLQRLFL